ncbi:rho guanine nucleotide exchange factor 7 [Elysia marginata]|uniref:Rho guanine nucleotide exchange factor 7 n=1 Tax=Elysia marginata TaxID=1093978 RepID=A0AAV4H9W8_9GAST|nr:rho guanine nucleotide exchange factor 7 [Elysia marginata]
MVLHLRIILLTFNLFEVVFCLLLHRTVVDTVYALQDRVKELEQEQRRLRADVDEERRCRRKLELLVKQQISKFMGISCSAEADGSGGGPGDPSVAPSSQDGIPSSQDGGS